MDSSPTDLAVAAEPFSTRVNWGRWIVDCRSCPSALQLPPGADVAECWDCEAPIGPLVWPPDPGAIEAALSFRPDPNTRNWEPGETVIDLIAENVAHGLVPEHWDELMRANGGTLDVATVVEGRVVSGVLLEALPSGTYRPSIGA